MIKKIIYQIKKLDNNSLLFLYRLVNQELLDRELKMINDSGVE